MPSHMPSSFAAAAGQGSNRDPRNGAKSESRGNGDWAKKENKPALNGTLTLRRSSTNPIGQISVSGDTPTQQESLVSQQIAYEQNLDFRYSKKDFLDIFNRQNESGLEDDGNVSHLYVDGWAPGQFQGSNSRVGWGKNNDGRESYPPDICWDLLGDTRPVSLEEMSEQEKKLFQGDINSPYKPPPQIVKDSNVNGRKPSFSHGQVSTNFNHPSPVSSRPGTRRQQTNDSATTEITSPNGTNRFSRDEPSQTSRKFENKDSADERSEDKSSLPFNGLIRANNTGSTHGTGQVFPWANPTSSSISPMGAFGNFALSNPTNAATSERWSATSRAESRFFQSTLKENLEDSSRSTDRSWRPRQRTDTDPFADEVPSGSMNTIDDDSGQIDQRVNGSDTPIRGSSGDLGSSEIPGFPEQSHQTPRPANEKPEPLSPSDTNPYRSPPGPVEENKQLNIEGYENESHLQNRIQGLGGIIENGQEIYGIIPRGFPSTTFDESEHNQATSGTGTMVIPQIGGLPSLGTIRELGGWPAASSSPMGITERENRPNYPSAFGASLFGPMGDTQSPGPSNLTGIFGPASNASTTTTAPRGSKLGTLFPAAMQAQMQGTENDPSAIENETRQPVTFGAIVRNSFTPSRDMESPIRASRHACEDLFQVENSRSLSVFPNPENTQVSAVSFNNPQQTLQQSQASTETATSKQLPTTQQRMMVMPDRMRWLYLDPQAQVQGPFSGLEMHDWYKASFFTPDLSVKKLEDADFEPLGQLIRRIGNSREPFLVPQIGIPHGQPSTQTGSAFSPPAVGHGPGLAQSGTVQPPFANAFPSFGTTLTAEQQNNLERRKQEEQYLMARQREFLAQQQVNMKQMQLGALPSALHHSGLHNLQNQTSFGGISSPIGIPQPPLGNVPSFFEGLSRQVPASALPGEFYREEESTRINLRDRHGHQVNPLLSHSDTQNQAQKIEDIDFTARLQEFEKLREHSESEDSPPINLSSQKPRDSIDTPSNLHQPPQASTFEQPAVIQKSEDSDLPAHNSLTLSHCSQKNTSLKQTQPSTSQKDSPWAKINSNIPLPFPPPQIASPLPTSTVKMDRSNLPESYSFEIKSESKTSEYISSPSVAPWIKDPIDIPKVVSLKAVTEAEAKKAAKAEEIAAAANRRTSSGQELKSNAIQQTVSPPGLPTTAIWGSFTTPAHGTPVKSAWANSVTKSQNLASKQKTLADIQREEELRKQKLAAATVAVASQPSSSGYGNKRYADLASKTAPNTTSTGGPTWFTVGAGGKVKVPTGPAVSTQAPVTRSSSAQSMTLSTRISSKPNSSRNTAVPGSNNVNLARDELTKWAKATLEKGLNPGINVNEFVTILSSFPSEPSIIADSIYSQSQTMNGNDFAMEFIRRRNNAEKGIIEPANSSTGSALSTAADKSGGWSEVAKKGPPKEEPVTDFKFVPNKKKSKK